MLVRGIAAAQTFSIAVALRLLLVTLFRAAVLTATTVGVALAVFASSAFAGQWYEPNADGEFLFCAAEDGNIAELKRLIAKGTDVRRATEYGTIPLRFLATEGYIAAVGPLVKDGTNVNQENEKEWAPLFSTTENRKNNL